MEKQIARFHANLQPRHARDGDELEFAFETTELREICESRRKAKAVLGVLAARKLEQRLADLDAVETVADFVSLFADQMIKRSPAEQSVRLNGGYILVFCAGHVNVPMTRAGATDWSKVSRIRITALEASDG